MTIRPAVPDDIQTAAEWWAARNPEGGFNPAVIPPIGVVCEDDQGPCGMVWAHLSCNIGVAFLEDLIMRPGLPLAQSARIGEALMEGIAAAVKPLDYGLLVAYALPGCARYLSRMGWERGDPRLKMAMTKIIL